MSVENSAGTANKSAAIGRRSFLKWAALTGGAAAAASNSILNTCTPRAAHAQDESADMVANTTDALETGSTGLPYGADKVVPTICGCGDACGMLHMGQAYVKDGSIVYYEGCPDAENKGHLCARGMSALSIINSPNRIKYPMRRTNEKGVEGEFERISWDEAYDLLVESIASAIEEEGPQTCSLTRYHWGNMTLRGAYDAFKRLWNFDGALGPSGCQNDLMLGPIITLGDIHHSLEEDPYESKLILMWGENDPAAKPSEWAFSYAKGVNEHNAYLIHVEPRISEGAEKADLYLPVRPGTDAYLALAMCNVIINEGLEDKDFIAQHTYGYDEFKELVMKYDPETVEKITWTPADRIRKAARLYATMKPAMICVGRGGNQAGSADSNAGWLMSRAITCLIGLTGNAGHKGDGFSMEASEAPRTSTQWHWPNAAATALHGSTVKEALIERAPVAQGDINSGETVMNQAGQGGTWGGMERLYTRKPYGYRVWMGNSNPAGTSGGKADMDNALKQIPLVVIMNRLAHWTASGYADLLIPICTWAEAYGWRLDWQWLVESKPAIDPMFESVSDYDFMRELSLRLADRLGIDRSKAWPWETKEEYMALYTENECLETELKKRVDEGYTEFEGWLEDHSCEKVCANPHGMPNPFVQGLNDFIPYKAKYYPDLAPEGTDPEEIFFPTPAGGDYPGDGKLLFKADWLPERTLGALPALPVPEEPCDSWYAEGNPIESGNWEESDLVKAGYDLVACGKAHKHWQFISFNQDKDGGPASAWLREAFDDAARPCVELNPQDAEARGLEDGDLVVVESIHGATEPVTLVVTEKAMPGVCVPPCHWGKVQNAIYPSSPSLYHLDESVRTQVNPGPIGEFGTGTSTLGGQNTQSAVLCKVYKYEG